MKNAAFQYSGEPAPGTAPRPGHPAAAPYPLETCPIRPDAPLRERRRYADRWQEEALKQTARATGGPGARAACPVNLRASWLRGVPQPDEAARDRWPARHVVHPGVRRAEQLRRHVPRP